MADDPCPTYSARRGAIVVESLVDDAADGALVDELQRYRAHRSRALGSYRRTAARDVDPRRRVVMAYDGVIRFLLRAAQAIDQGDLPAKTRCSSRALRLLAYLRERLDLDGGGATAQMYDALYSAASRRIVRASAAADATEMRAVAELVEPLRDAWLEAERPR